jgi:DNA-directed RNA polymerase subunit M/transcription elongation factor TFIIS
MAVWKLKCCPRCNGDLFIQRETDGWYEECLSCGYQRDVSNLVIINTVGQIKMKNPTEARETRYSDVRISSAT